MKQNFFKVSILLAGLTLAGSTVFTSCGDDELTDVAEVRPETPAGDNPVVNSDGLYKLPTITGVTADEANKLMTISGTNLLSALKITHTFTAEEDGKTLDGKEYKKGDEVVEDITSTIDKENSTNGALVLALAEGKITLYYDSYDVSKVVVDGGYNVPVPVINDGGFKTDWESKTMTIEGENLGRVAHILVGDKNPVDIVENEKTEITENRIVLPLWDGKIALNYDRNNPNRIVKLDGYKFPVPEITSVKMKSGDETQMVISGTNFDIITGLKIAGEEMDIPEDATKEAIIVALMEGEIVMTYPFNDGELEFKNAGYFESLPELPYNHLNIIDNLTVGAGETKEVNKEDGSLTITPAGNYRSSVVLTIPEEERAGIQLVKLALEASVSGGQIVFVFTDGTKATRYNWDANNKLNYNDTKLDFSSEKTDKIGEDESTQEPIADKTLEKIIINNQENGNVFTLKYVEVTRGLPEGHIQIVDKVAGGDGDKIVVNRDGSISITPAGNYTGTIILDIAESDAKGAKTILLALESSIGGGQLVPVFTDGTEGDAFYNWDGSNVTNYNDTKYTIPEGKTLKQIKINNQEKGNVFTLKYVEITK
ncbi:MAG: hypothetical protein IKQ46_03570 [Bacteroidales bacterium]|nr:hypothetical protein [Bacteroidales bacterium]